MAIAKNFVVRYGLEVDSNLIFADPNINKVGIGTTTPANTLQVFGGIGATDISVSGFGTISTLSGNNLSYTRGNVADLSGQYLNYTGLGTVTNLRGLRLSYNEAYINTGIATNLSGTYLNYTGLGTITNLTGQNLNYSSGIVTNISGTNLSYTGIASVASLNIGTTNVLSTDRQLRNILSLDSVTTKTIEEAIANSPNNFTDLNVAGISSLGTVKVHSGIVTAVSGVVTYYGDGTYLNLKKNPSTGVGLGVSAGVLGYGVTFINFYGTNILESFYDPNVGIATFHIGTLDNSMSYFALVKKLDDISASFNNSTATFALKMNGVAYTPINSSQLLINLGGVIQKPGIDYTVSSSNITFTTPPQNGLTFCGLILNESNQKLIDPLDNISSSFNGITTSFSLNVGGVSTAPVNSHYTLVNVGGAVQSPGIDYTISSSNIIFNVPPTSELSFSGIIFHNVSGISTAGITTTRVLKKVDDFSSSFDGTTKAFPLTLNSIPISPFNSNQILVVLGGVVQNPGVDYQVTGSSIIFAVPPARGLKFFGNVIGSTSADMPMESLNVIGNTILTNVFADSITLGGGTDVLSVGNIQISSGIITATSGIVTYYGDGRFNSLRVSGNVSIAGTLTYEDVTNVDSIGLITARSGVHVGTGITYTEDLVVSGDARITGILSIGQSTVVINGNTDTITAANIVVTNSISGSGASGILTTGNLVGYATEGYVNSAVASGSESFWSQTAVGINTISNVGIGTTNPTSKLTIEGNANITGIVTASSFVGNLTGTASTASASSTAYGLSGTPNISVGVVTASSFVGNLTGTATTASTVNILNTNGLSTVYYPTFVESRTDGQIVRADVDLTYRTDDNTLTVPNIQLSSSGLIVGTGGTVVATTSGGSVGLGTATPVSKFDLLGPSTQNIVSIASSNIDCSLGNYFIDTVNGTRIYTISGIVTNRVYSFSLEVTHTTGTITWFSGVEWPGGTPPTLTTGKTHLFMFVTDDGGSRWRGSSLINYTN